MASCREKSSCSSEHSICRGAGACSTRSGSQLGGKLGCAKGLAAQHSAARTHFHTESARLFGATEEEITEASLIAKNTMGWSTWLNTMQFDYDEFRREFDQIAAHVREQMSQPDPA